MSEIPENQIFAPKSAWDGPYDPAVRIQDLRVFCEAEVAPAVHDAWILIIENGLEVPSWLAAPTKVVIALGLKTVRVAYKSKMKHYYRWRKVKELRALGVKWDDVYREASNALRGTENFRSPDTIEESYQMVQTALKNADKDPKTALQYYTAMKQTRYIMETASLWRSGQSR